LTTNCTFRAIAIDADLGSSNASGFISHECVTSTNLIYTLGHDEGTQSVLRAFRSNDEITLDLEEPHTAASDSEQMALLLVGDPSMRFHRVLAGKKNHLGNAHHMHTTGLLTDETRYFNGQRRIRLLSVVVSVKVGDTTFTADYAGATTAAREKYAANQRTFMDLEYRWSTYNKLGFDSTGSVVKTVDLGSAALSKYDCQGRGFQLSKLASAALDQSLFANVDGVIYYLPEEATPACGHSGHGTLGICYVGPLSSVNKLAASPPYNIMSRSADNWKAGCWTRFQQNNVDAEANIASHV
jgi:hypothetical protein